jgi:indole-3-glycerol phosphate synthase
MLDDLQPHLDSVVCESGIRTHEDIVRLQEHGLRNYLVGESLLRKPRPGTALRALIGGSD